MATIPQRIIPDARFAKAKLMATQKLIEFREEQGGMTPAEINEPATNAETLEWYLTIVDNQCKVLWKRFQRDELNRNKTVTGSKY